MKKERKQGWTLDSIDIDISLDVELEIALVSTLVAY